MNRALLDVHVDIEGRNLHTTQHHTFGTNVDINVHVPAFFRLLLTCKMKTICNIDHLNQFPPNNNIRNTEEAV